MNENTVMAVVIGAAAAGLIMQLAVRLSAIEARLKRLSRLEAKMDAVLKHQNIDFDEFAGVPPGVREALEEGKTIEAIRRFRQATGVGLKEAKGVVDELRARRAPID